MSLTWSHLTSPPHPPFPVPVSDNVFLPVPWAFPTSPLRISSSEPALNFVLKGLGVLNSDEKDKEVKISEVKTRRRNTLLVTPGEVIKVRSLTFIQTTRPILTLTGLTQTQPMSLAASTAKPMLPRTPQPQFRVHTQPHAHEHGHEQGHVHVHARQVSESSTPSTTSSAPIDDRSEYDSCTDQSAFSTPTSEYTSAKEASSPCPIPSPRQLDAPFASPFSFSVSLGGTTKRSNRRDDHCRTGLRSSMTKRIGENKFKFWRSPPPQPPHIHSSPFEADQAHGKAKRRKVSPVAWEGFPVPEEMVSPKSVMRVNELGTGLMWTSLA
ncbi:hypothetical protein IAU59_005363 [Kwoniella sp. CBS 9459]